MRGGKLKFEAIRKKYGLDYTPMGVWRWRFIDLPKPIITKLLNLAVIKGVIGKENFRDEQHKIDRFYFTNARMPTKEELVKICPYLLNQAIKPEFDRALLLDDRAHLEKAIDWVEEYTEKHQEPPDYKLYNRVIFRSRNK